MQPSTSPARSTLIICINSDVSNMLFFPLFLMGFRPLFLVCACCAGLMRIVFLAISGFLITLAVLEESGVEKRPVRATITWIVKRALRMWPAMLASIFFGWLIGDFNVNITRLIYKTVTFTSNVDPNSAPFTFIIAWSNSVDVKVGAFLVFTAAVAKRYGFLRQSLMHALLAIA